MADNGSSPKINLTNSQRSVNKATYVPAKLPEGTPPPGQVLEKATYARSLAMTRPEFFTLQAQAVGQGPPTAARRPLSLEALNLVGQMTWRTWPDVLTVYGPRLAKTSRADLVDVGLALIDLRRAAADQAASSGVPTAAVSRVLGLAPVNVQALIDLVNRTEVAVRTFQFHAPVQPVGALHLERLEMTPAGVEHGELVHSVPLTPGETVNISHREWTITTQTFETIVQDAFEGFSETGVTDKTDLSQATENETKHSTSLDVNGSVTASYNGGAYSVTAAAATDYSDKTESRNSVKESIAHSLAITRHASARTRKEHKTSFRVSSVAGAEDLAVRTLTNPTQNPIRVDYFQLIRKWRVDLIRYGLRLTYDLVIPNPGIDLVGRVKELEELEEWLSKATFVFDLAMDKLDPAEDSWLKLQATYGIALEPPPAAAQALTIAKNVPKNDKLLDFLELDVPDGYALAAGGTVNATIHGHDGNLWLDFAGIHLPTSADSGKLDLGTGDRPLPAPDGATGHLSVPFFAGDFDALQFTGSYTVNVLAGTQDAWRVKTWQALHDAAQERFDHSVERAKDRKAYLEDQIGRFDALTLRKMEHEEVMKWVLQWILGGPSLQTGPVSTLAGAWPLPEPGDPATPNPAASSGTNPTSAGLAIPSLPEEGVDPASLTRDQLTKVLEYGEFVKFIHNAVEWENLLFFAYPYFWDAVDNWPFKRFLLHPDPVHREFLRAGAVRVVLTIRPGFEDAFIRLVETGNYQASDTDVAAAGGTPYVSLGQQVHNQDLTNYQNIPPANPDRTARPLLYALQQAAWNDMQAIIAALEEFKNNPNKHGRYPPGPEKGLPKTLKDFLLSEPQTVPGTGDKSFAAMLREDLQNVPVNPGGNFDDPAATFTDPWGNPYHYTTPGPATQVLHGDYELVSYGSNNKEETDPNDPLSENITSWAEGLLVAQWFEYTPTSALDVSVDTTLTITSPPLPG